MQPKPRQDAVFMVDMLARHQLCLIPHLECVLAHGTLGLVGGKRLGRDPDVRQGFNSGFGSRRRAITIGIVLRELLDEPLEARANKIVPEVAGADDGTTLENDLDVGATGEQLPHVILEEEHRIERSGSRGGGGFGGADGAEEVGEVPRAAKLEVAGWRQEKWEGGWGEEEGVVAATGNGEGEDGVTDGERGGIGAGRRRVDLLEESTTADRAGDVEGRGGEDGDVALALVAEVLLEVGAGAGGGHGDGVGRGRGRGRGNFRWRERRAKGKVLKRPGALKETHETRVSDSTISTKSSNLPKS